MRTRSGPKRGLSDKVNHHLDGADDPLLRRKRSIVDAIRKLTSGPVADGCDHVGPGDAPSLNARRMTSQPTGRNTAKCDD
jgi:hypothetical protein